MAKPGPQSPEKTPTFYVIWSMIKGEVVRIDGQSRSFRPTSWHMLDDRPFELSEAEKMVREKKALAFRNGTNCDYMAWPVGSDPNMNRSVMAKGA